MTLISLGALDALVAAGQLDAEEAARWSERFRGARRDDQDSSSIGLELGATLGSLAIKIPTANLSTLERSIVVNKALQSLFVFSIELYDDGLSLTW